MLIEIPRLEGVPYLESGPLIYLEDLEGWDKKAGVKVGASVALFVAGLWAGGKAVGRGYGAGRKEGSRLASRSEPQK